MKIKAKQEIIETLQKHKGEIQRELDLNKRNMKHLVERQTIHKRKIVELNKIIHSLSEQPWECSKCGLDAHNCKCRG